MTNTFALGTFSEAGKPHFPGVVIEQGVIPLNAFAQLTATDSMLSLLENWEENFAALPQQVDAVKAAAVPLASLKIHPPVNLPCQVFYSGANYKKHVIDLIVDEGGGPASENMTQLACSANARCPKRSIT